MQSLIRSAKLSQVRMAALWALLVVVAAVSLAEDWPEFRGPTGQGLSSEREVPIRWSETEGVVWKTAVPGRGWSTPVVASGRVFLTTALDQGHGSLRLLVFDASTGRQELDVEVFRTEESRAPNPKNSLASPTPVVDGERVYVHFGAHGTAALSHAGKVLWKTRFPYRSQHGGGGSPILYEDLLVLSADGYDRAFVVAIDTRTGKTRWKTERRRPISQAYSTPLLIRLGERDQIVSVGAFRAAAYDPHSGAEIWSVGYDQGFSNVPRPVYGHGLVYIATGFQAPSLLAVRPDGRGDVTDTHIAWTLRRGAPLTPSPLLVGDELYLLSDMGIATCVDARTGDMHWRERLGGNYSASPVFAGGHVYFQSEEGVTTVIEAGPELEVRAKNRIDGATLASLAISDGSIFLRSDSHVYRLGIR